LKISLPALFANEGAKRLSEQKYEEFPSGNSEVFGKLRSNFSLQQNERSERAKIRGIANEVSNSEISANLFHKFAVKRRASELKIRRISVRKFRSIQNCMSNFGE